MERVSQRTDRQERLQLGVCVRLCVLSYLSFLAGVAFFVESLGRVVRLTAISTCVVCLSEGRRVGGTRRETRDVRRET